VKKFTANYSNTNHNFVIQNLSGNKLDSIYAPAICIIKNIFQRGCPTKASKFIQSKIGNFYNNDKYSNIMPLIAKQAPVWERIIRGDQKSNYYPARKFFEQLIPKYFPEFPFFRQLLLPEVPINEITQIEVDEFSQNQVDFYLPQAFLVIEIDGAQHDSIKDKRRDAHLGKFGIKTVRITTDELEAENDGFNAKISQIIQRINQVSKLQEEKKLKGDFHWSTFKDYADCILKKQNHQNPFFNATAMIRFQLLILELIEIGQLQFKDDWTFSIFYHEISETFPSTNEGSLINNYESIFRIAIDDIFIWLDKLCQLQKIEFEKPSNINIDYPNTFEKLKASNSEIKVDFSLNKRYTDEFQNHPEILFVRTDYFEYYRHYKKTNSISPEYVGLEPYNHFEISTNKFVCYRFQFSGETDDEVALVFFLENIFGYESFLPGQLPIITNALSRNDTIGLLPTGGGKSLCYQFAALLQPAISFVVCPIKSLMYDQKQDLDSIKFTRINSLTSDDDSEDKEKIMKEFSQGKYFFIFISPERFQIQAFRQYLSIVNQKYRISYAVIDEVHCLSEWGHDFRTSYLNLARTIHKYCYDFKFIGLTATASVNVLKDVQIEFGIKQENVKTLSDYTRKEIEFHVINDKHNKDSEIKTLIRKINKELDILIPNGENSKCSIIFTPTVNGRKGCYKLSTELSNDFKSPIYYYSGDIPKENKSPIMSSSDFDDYKKEIQKQFKQNNFTLLAATKAFGMGINKKNIYCTIHYGIPSSMEALYQEAGRAGRDKAIFQDTKANCYVLFSKSSDKQVLEKIWDRKTPFSKLKELSSKIDGDINTNLYLFASGLDVIKNEYLLIKEIISKYGNPKQEGIKIHSDNLNSTKSKTEKAIYRLTQLGIIDDWRVENFFSGEFDVDFSDYSDLFIKENLKRTINKYDPDFDFSALANNDAYHIYNEIWSKEASVVDKCIVLLLQWAYDHFAYNRIESLKNIYENCDLFITGKLTSSEFKLRLEDYFRFTETTYLLQDIAENPNDFYKWFDVFYQIENNEVSNSIINWEQRQSLLSNLSRFLESYQYNTGLDFISGVIRLLINDFENMDGRDRFESSLKQIMKYQFEAVEYILNKLLIIGKEMAMESKNKLTASIISFYPDDKFIVKKLNQELSDEYTTEILLSGLTFRITKINQLINGELIKIR